MKLAHLIAPDLRHALYALVASEPRAHNVRTVHVVHTRIAPKPVIKKEFGDMERYTRSRAPSDRIVNCHGVWEYIASHESKDRYKPVRFEPPKAREPRLTGKDAK